MPTVTVTVTDSSGNTSVPASASWTVQTQQQSAPLKIMGMSAPSNLWSQRMGEVGANGVRARRIFGNMTAAGTDQGDLITAAKAAGMLPVVSYKEPDVAGVIAGTYDSWLTAIGTYLASFNIPIAATFHHEPRGDMTVTQFRQASRRFYDRVKSANVLVGPILNGFLLDNASGRTEFATYTDPSLMADWDWFGIDTYHPSSTSTTYPGDRIAPLMDFLTAQGQASMPIGVGEYNGFTADAIAQSGEDFLAAPNLWFACVWNSTGGLGTPLSGDRLAAYQATKADARAQQ